MTAKMTEPLAWTDQSTGHDVSMYIENIKRIAGIGNEIDHEGVTVGDLSAILFSIEQSIGNIERILDKGDAS